MTDTTDKAKRTRRINKKETKVAEAKWVQPPATYIVSSTPPLRELKLSTTIRKLREDDTFYRVFHRGNLVAGFPYPEQAARYVRELEQDLDTKAWMELLAQVKDGDEQTLFTFYPWQFIYLYRETPSMWSGELIWGVFNSNARSLSHIRASDEWWQKKLFINRLILADLGRVWLREELRILAGLQGV